MSVNAGGGRGERRFGGGCCRHTGGREAGRDFVNEGWGFLVTQTLEGVRPRRKVVLVLMMLKRDLRFPRAPASLPGGLHTVEYRGTSLIRKRPPLGPYSRAMPRALWHS